MSPPASRRDVPRALASPTELTETLHPKQGDLEEPHLRMTGTMLHKRGVYYDLRLLVPMLHDHLLSVPPGRSIALRHRAPPERAAAQPAARSGAVKTARSETMLHHSRANGTTRAAHSTTTSKMSVVERAGPIKAMCDGEWR